jgi:aminomethyltransferase
MRMSEIRATPFHSRTAEANRLNAWTNRIGWTLAAHYGDPSAECIAARMSAVVADISWRSRIVIEGARAEEFLSRLMTRNPAKLAPGYAFKALWLTDGGGMRGAGALARFGRESFQLIASESDLDWITRGAALFDVQVRELVEEEGGLAIIGPYARKIVEAAGLDGALEALTFRKSFWRGFDVTLSRFGEHGGYELWCKADDAPIVWNRIVKAGETFALRPAGLNAMDVLDLEAGVPRPGRDYCAAREASAKSPSPFDLGLESLVEADHELFNGRTSLLSMPRAHTRVGVEWDDETSAPNAPLLRNGVRVGETMSSAYSPALQRAIALATIETSAADPGTQLTMAGKSVRVVALPFLPAPDPIEE